MPVPRQYSPSVQACYYFQYSAGTDIWYRHSTIFSTAPVPTNNTQPSDISDEYQYPAVFHPVLCQYNASTDIRPVVLARYQASCKFPPGFRNGKNAAQAAKKLRDVYGEEALKDRQCRKWFDKFHSGNFSLKDEQRSDRLNEVDDDQIKAIVESDRYVTVGEIDKKLKILKSTIDRHIRRLGLVKKLDIWIAHELKKIYLSKRINVCDLHLKRNEFDIFLKQIITGDEKWIVYSKVVRKRSWSKRDEPPTTTSNAELHQKKIMLSVW